MVPFLHSLCVALAAPALMRIPLPQLDTLIEVWVGAKTEPSRNPDQVAATVLDVLRTGWPLVRRGCLTRGLTLYCALRRAGIRASLEFGMGRVSVGDGFDGHCWVVLDDKPYLESRDPHDHYVTMYVLGLRTPARAPAAATR